MVTKSLTNKFFDINTETNRTSLRKKGALLVADFLFLGFVPKAKRYIKKRCRKKQIF